MNTFNATEYLKDLLAEEGTVGLHEESSTLMWSHDGREYLVSLVLFDVTKEEV